MILGHRERLLLGQYLADCRRAMDLSQREVTNKLKYGSAQYLSNIERGISEPPMKHLKFFVNLYKIPKRNFINLYQGLYADSIKEVLS